MGKFLKLLATLNLAKSTTFFGNFCKGVKINHFSCGIIFGQHLWTFGDFFLVTLLVVVQIVNSFTYATLAYAIFCLLVILQSLGGSPGLVVKVNSCCEGCRFESGWTFFHINCKICIDVCLKKTKKGPEIAHF